MFGAASEVRKTMSLAMWQSRSVERAAALKIVPLRCCARVDIVVGAIGSVRLAHFNIPQQFRRGDQDYGQRIV
jgi:hypothetical protein